MHHRRYHVLCLDANETNFVFAYLLWGVYLHVNSFGTESLEYSSLNGKAFLRCRLFREVSSACVLEGEMSHLISLHCATLHA